MTTATERTAASFRVECRGRRDGQLRAIEVRELIDDETGESTSFVAIEIAPMNPPDRDGRDSFVFLMPDAAKRLAIALDHIAFGIDPASAALGVGPAHPFSIGDSA
jgi:hypothetical protein